MKSLLLTLAIFSTSAMANLDMTCIHPTQRKALRITAISDEQIEVTNINQQTSHGLKAAVQDTPMFVKFSLDSYGTNIWIPNSAYKSPSNKTLIKVGAFGEEVYRCVRISK